MLSSGARKLTLAGAACMAVLAISSAGAADLAPVYRKAPVMALAPTWTGFYIGGNVGYGWDKGSSGLSAFATDPVIAPALADVLAAGSYPSSFSPNARGVIGGGQIGYNWQVSPQWLFGLETDLQASDIKGSVSQTLFPALFDTTSTSFTKSIEWFGTVRGRVGFLVNPQWLLYGTGGLAYGRTKTTFGTVDVTSGCIVGGTICAGGSLSDVHVGWTAGAGVEAMVAPNWSVKLEYLYVDLGKQTFDIPSFTVPVTFTTSTHFQEHIVRGGLNYHFNWGGPVVARY